jgi:hypothetical protein
VRCGAPSINADVQSVRADAPSINADVQSVRVSAPTFYADAPSVRVNSMRRASAPMRRVLASARSVTDATRRAESLGPAPQVTLRRTSGPVA